MSLTMKKITFISLLFIAASASAQHGFVIADSTSIITVNTTNTDQKQLGLYVYEISEWSDSSKVTVKMGWFSDTLNYRRGIFTNPDIYSIPPGLNSFTVNLQNKTWATVPMVLTYLKNYFTGLGYKIAGNIN